ncbi:MAG: 6-bladed beta-propeller [Longimicrobiales bacterium]
MRKHLGPPILAFFLAAPAMAQIIQLPAGDKPLVAQLTPVFSVGGSVAEEWAEFTGLPDVAFDASGNLYVWDQLSGILAVVDARGKLLRRVGARGSGPGEFRMPHEAFAVFRNGTIVLNDLGKRAFIVYEPQGAARDVPVEFTEGRPDRIAVAGERRLAFVPGLLLINGQPQLLGQARVAATHRPVGAFTLDGEVRTLFKGWLVKYPQQTERFTRLLLAPDIYWTALSNGVIAVADSTTYTVRLIDTQGNVSTLQRPIPVRRTTDADRDVVRAAVRTSLVGPPVTTGARGRNPNASSGGRVRLPPEDAERIAQASPVYEEIQTIQQLAGDWEDRLWIRRAGSPVDAGPIDLVTTTGAYVGTIQKGRIPAAFGPNGLVAFVERGEFDIPVIKVQRLTLTPSTAR